MTDSSAPLIGRIRKLLAKAEGTDNASEAEAFSAKAAQLIAEHRIDPRHVREALEHGELGLRRIDIGRGAYVRARLALLHAVARAHGCELVYETGAVGTTAIVAGFDSDLDVTDVLYTSLHAQAANQMAAVKRRTPAATLRWRRSFLFGFASRVSELFERARSRAAAAPPVAGDAPTLFDELTPDVLARDARVHQYAAHAFGPVVAARSAAPAQASAWRDGHRAAGTADLGRTRLAGRLALNRGKR
jgi:Protein of unknown function (DUF2786)